MLGTLAAKTAIIRSVGIASRIKGNRQFCVISYKGPEVASPNANPKDIPKVTSPALTPHDERGTAAMVSPYDGA
ncbi:MAG: hypothetical protein QXT45_06700 [Candidatus Bilamarchaeaceae archaeon]